MIKISKEKLEKLYYSMPNKEVCKRLNVTNTTLIKYLRSVGIKTKGMGNRSTDYKVKLLID